MATKLLFELLREDQEPFTLKKYIQELRHQLKKPFSQAVKPVSRTSTLSSRLCRNTCFLSSHEASEPTASPPADHLQTRITNPNAILLHIPARTASLLFEAAVRIQKQSPDDDQKFTPRKIRSGFGFFGSVLKRLTQKLSGEKGKEKSYREGSERTGSDSGDSVSSENCFPERACHCALQKGDPRSLGSSGFSFCRRETEEQESCHGEKCSPVSTLVLAFVVNHGEEEEGEQVENDEHSDGGHGGYETLERAKQRLLKRLRRFEQLAGLDIEKAAINCDGDEAYESEEDEIVKSDRDRGVGTVVWRQVEFGTANLVVEREVRKKVEGWEDECREQIQDAASEIELHIFWVLVDELAEELTISSSKC